MSYLRNVIMIVMLFVHSKHSLSTPIRKTCQQSHRHSLPVSSCPPRDRFLQNVNQKESSLERFHGHFESKGGFCAQILPASQTCFPIKLSCDLPTSYRKFSKTSFFIRKIKNGKGNKYAANKIIAKWTSIVKIE